jgi:hypothetical protein
MNPVAQANPNIVAVVRIYFYSLVVFDALVLLNLCIAVMSFAFQRIRDSAKGLEPEVRVEDPKMQSLKNIAMELNPSIFSKHVKRSFQMKLSSNVVAPDDSFETDVDAVDFDKDPDSTDPKLPTAPNHSTSFRRKARHAVSDSRYTQSDPATSTSTAWSKFHYFCLHLVSLPAFEYFILVIVCLNCLTLAINFRGMSENFTTILDMVELVFSGIFFFEMLLKVISFGPYRYVVDNWFDFLVIAFSVVDILTTYAFTAQELPNLTALRMFRILRIFRALKRIKKLMQVLGMIFKSGAALRNLLIFSFVWFSALAIVGKELFGRRELLAKVDEPKIDRMNFDTMLNAYELLYRVATGEGWSSVMRKFMVVNFDSALIENEASLADPISTVPAFIFFVSFYLFSNFILINVLVSVILENFEVSNVDRVEEYMNMLSAEDEEVRLHQKNSSFGDAASSIIEWISAQQAREQFYIRRIALHIRKSNVSILPISKSSSNSQVSRKLSVHKSTSSERLQEKVVNEPSNEGYPKTPLSEKVEADSQSQSSSDQLKSSNSQSSATLRWKPGFMDRIRILSHTVLTSSWYPYVLYGTIGLSSLTLAFTPPKHQVCSLFSLEFAYMTCSFFLFPFRFLIQIFCLADNHTGSTSMVVHKCCVLVYFLHGIFLQRVSQPGVLLLHGMEFVGLRHSCSHHDRSARLTRSNFLATRFFPRDSARTRSATVAHAQQERKHSKRGEHCDWFAFICWLRCSAVPHLVSHVFCCRIAIVQGKDGLLQ